MDVVKIPNSLEVINEKLNAEFSNCTDFRIRRGTINKDIEFLIAYIDGISKIDVINNNIIKPLVIDSKYLDMLDVNDNNLISSIKNNLLSASRVNTSENLNEAIEGILFGETLVFISNQSSVLLVDTSDWKGRNVEQSETERVVKGPREGFTEILDTNIALLRKTIRNTKLKFEIIKLGRQSNTDVCIAYIDGLARNDIIDTVKRRLNRIKTDAILESGYMEEFIEDGTFSLFPTVGNSEKPDKVAAKLLEGRVAILCEGTPVVLTVPFIFVEGFQVSEDYYSNFIVSSAYRIIRIIGLIVSTMLPALYVAVSNFHTDVIPFKLLLYMAGSREGTPFSSIVETLLMLTIFELLHEAGVRIPKAVGSAVSIVGALVLGEAAVNAGLVSDTVVIVVATTAISSFAIAPFTGAVSIIRIVLLLAANIIGILGIALVSIVIVAYLCSLRSFGVPYLYPFSPLYISDLKDSFIKVPIWMMLTRPKPFINKDTNNKYRMNIDFRKKED